MRRETLPRRMVAASFCLLLLTAGQTLSTNLSTSTRGNYPPTSWALGIVVPEGSALEGGGSLRWEDVTNVTGLLTLPSISNPDSVVYGVMSLMAQDGSVMQAAVGVYPNSTEWLAFSWFISDIHEIPPTYVWILNLSDPGMSPGALVSISMFRSSGMWNLRLSDLGAGSAIERTLPPGIAPSLKPGDQEVFALESYSRASATFRGMGNLTLTGLFLDGRKVTGGAYSYGSWDPNHHPVFVVGSSGASPPYFISLRFGGDGSFVWGFADNWSSGNLGIPEAGTVLAVVLLVSSLLVIVLVYLSVSRRSARHTTSDSAG